LLSTQVIGYSLAISNPAGKIYGSEPASVDHVRVFDLLDTGWRGEDRCERPDHPGTPADSQDSRRSPLIRDFSGVPKATLSGKPALKAGAWGRASTHSHLMTNAMPGLFPDTEA